MKEHPKVKTEHGYTIVFVGKEHHLADCRGYAYEHRVEAEKKIGRKLKKGEHVHHIDHIRSNNEHDNLEVTKSASHHHYLHRTIKSNKKKPDEPNIKIECACGCGGKFLKYDKGNRPRTFISGHNGEKSELVGLIISQLSETPKTIGAITNALYKWKPTTIKAKLSEMATDGKVVRVKVGVYAKLGTPIRKNILIKCECGCGKKFKKYDSGWRERKYISGHNMSNKK